MFMHFLSQILTLATSNIICFSYQAGTFFLTFVTYLLYHANRKVVGIVKQVWNENCSEVFPDSTNNNSNWCDWKPFGKNYYLLVVDCL